jgi:hypothetical protein
LAFGAPAFAFVDAARVRVDFALAVVPAAFERVVLLEDVLPRFAVVLFAGEAFVVVVADFVVDFAWVFDRRRGAVFVVPIGRASPTALTAALAASPTVPTTLPAVLPTVPAVLPAVLPTVPAVLPTVRPTDFTTLPGSGIGLVLLVPQVSCGCWRCCIGRAAPRRRARQSQLSLRV